MKKTHLYMMSTPMAKDDLSLAISINQNNTLCLATALINSFNPKKSAGFFLLFDLVTRSTLEEHSYVVEDAVEILDVFPTYQEYWFVVERWDDDALFLRFISSQLSNIEKATSSIMQLDFTTDLERLIGPFITFDASDSALFYIRNYNSSALKHVICKKHILDTSQIQSGDAQKLAYAESALVLSLETCMVVVRLDQYPEYSLLPVQSGFFQPEGDYGTSAWGFAVECLQKSATLVNWHWHHPSFIEYFYDAPNFYHYSDHVAAIQPSGSLIKGPRMSLEEKETFVVGCTLVNNYDYWPASDLDKTHFPPQKINFLHCLDEEGNMMGTCEDEIGEFIQLHLLGSHVVGIDKLADKWRAWSWNPLEDTHLKLLHLLEDEVEWAFILKQPDAAWLWLIEEVAEGLRISKRERKTFDLLEPALMLEQMKLLQHIRRGNLDWYKPREICVYQDTLLLSCFDQSNQLQLYQIA